MPAPPQCLTLSGACDAPRPTSNVQPHLPISRPYDEEDSIGDRNAAIYGQGRHEEQEPPLQILSRASTGLSYQQNLDCGFDGFEGNNVAFCRNTMGHCSDLLSRAYLNQPTSRDAKTGQQTGSHAIIDLSETLEETRISIQGRTDFEMLVRYPQGSHGTAPPLVSEAQSRVLSTHVLRMRSDASSLAAAPRMSMGKALEVPGSARPSKRRWERESDLAARDNQTKSSDHAQCSKKAKVDCDCDTNHTWWMTVKIGDLNKVLQRIHAAMGLVAKLAYTLEDLDEIAVRNLIDLLKDSRGILESAKDDMLEEGGTDRESLDIF